MRTAYLLPLTAVSLVLALAALGYRARGRHGYGPFVLGALAAVGLVVGKFVTDSDVAAYGSIAALIGASLWNAWPKSTKGTPPAPAETLHQLGGLQKEE